MGKKYVPSGYQIINIDFTSSDSEITVIPSEMTEDEKVLYDILNRGLTETKPILLSIRERRMNTRLIGFGVLEDGAINLKSETYNFYARIDNENLGLNFTEN